MTVRLLLGALTISVVVGGCAAIGPVLDRQTDVVIRGAADASGCGAAAEPTFRDDESDSSRVDREPRLAITSLSASTQDEAREAGFNAALPTPPKGVATQHVAVFGDAFAVYFAPDSIGDGDTIYDVLRGGGAMFTEQIAARGFVEDWAQRLGTRAVSVAVGDTTGTLVHRDPIGHGVRPFELQWEADGRRYQIIAGFDRAADVIDMARSIEC